jgi:hypothetical protein
VMRGEGDRRLNFGRHERGREVRVGPRGIDDCRHPELLVVVHHRGGRGLAGAPDPCRRNAEHCSPCRNGALNKIPSSRHARPPVRLRPARVTLRM